MSFSFPLSQFKVPKNMLVLRNSCTDLYLLWRQSGFTLQAGSVKVDWVENNSFLFFRHKSWNQITEKKKYYKSSFYSTEPPYRRFFFLFWLNYNYPVHCGLVEKCSGGRDRTILCWLADWIHCRIYRICHFFCIATVTAQDFNLVGDKCDILACIPLGRCAGVTFHH